MKNIALYRTLNEKQFSDICEIQNKYFYSNDGDLIELNVTEENGGRICLEAEDGTWDSITNGLILNVNISLKNLDMINQVAFNSSKVALCAYLYSNESKYNLCLKLAEFSANDNAFKIEETINIPKGRITGMLVVQYQLCLIEPGIANQNFGVNNSKGAILGRSLINEIILSGDGSVFPIINVSAPGQPLWKFIFDCDQPESDMFLEKVKIELNTSHRDYKLIDVNKKDTYCERLFIEIMQNSIFQFLCVLKIEGKLNDLNNTFMDGTVMQVAKYLVKVHNIKVDTIETLSNSINDYFNVNGGNV